MTTALPQTRTVTVALLGNPNTGKSTLFNALAGVRQRVGNYPGVTVEKKIGRLKFEGHEFTLIDLPGTYSLAPRSPDEMVTVDVLLGRQRDVAPPDVVLCIVDASNLQRNLYLVSQALEMNRPTVLALNMTDIARERGITIDREQLSERLGVPVIEIQANRKLGLEPLKRALLGAVERGARPPDSPFPEAFCREVDQLAQRMNHGDAGYPRYLVERLLLDTSGYLEHVDWIPAPRGASSPVAGHQPANHVELLSEVRAARDRLAAAGTPVPAVEAISRYRWVGEVLDGVVENTAERRVTWSDRIDQVLTHKVWGTLIFILVMIAMFQAIFSWAVLAMEWIEETIGQIGAAVGSLLPEGALQSLVVDGMIGGVGGVIVFLPQIFILFFFIAVLEDCGYMARAAYLMDRLMSRIGLSGKSFIPLLSSFACAIPGIMSARVIENRRDRLVTVLVAPLMSCSARLPVYTLLIGAFIPARSVWGGWLGLQGLTMFAAYSIGIVTAILVAWVLKTTILKGETPPFVMELPTYKFPSPMTVLMRMLDRGWSFIRRAGTLILAVSILIWAAAYFPRDPSIESDVRAQFAPEVARLEAALATAESAAEASPAVVERLKQSLAELDERVEQHVAGAYIQHSYLGRAGRWIEPAVRPLGWDWRIGCAVIASFPAREVVIGAMGVIYNVGSEQDEEFTSLKDRIREVTWDGTDRPVFTLPVALSILVFFALCAQCAATLVVLRRETNSWRWPAFTFIYMTTLAYAGAFVTYRVGTWLMG